MDLESFNTSRESLVPLLALNNKSNKNIIIFPTDKEAIEFSTDFSNLNKNIFHLPILRIELLIDILSDG